MALETFLTLIAFAFVAGGTPGPNTMMLFASGVNFGFRNTVPHMLGIAIGFLALLLAVGFGLGALLTTIPALYLVLKILGGGYLVYIAWRIATSNTLPEARAGAQPMTFIEAAAFQWVNPKAWVMLVTAMGIYTDPDHYADTVMLIFLAFAIATIPCVSAWAGFGSVLRSWLADPVRLKWFNISMAVLLVASLWPMLR
ncbi:LysE family translocator [uncultured Hoeflea sp.]|jgi:threonine/homoserine/homoserine lactone efflux protein|uniref:LysE family translocator n=1 Tax=uncultured Hoeflea sp. TaxID=538666 RepID=UPI0030D9C760|tara:strand:- start:313 stop:906 length:594 start_codon:yes stop_codon:yes gene_type:complete